MGGGSSTVVPKADVWSWDFSAGSWTAEASLPVARMMHRAAALNGSIYGARAVCPCLHFIFTRPRAKPLSGQVYSQDWPNQASRPGGCAASSLGSWEESVPVLLFLHLSTNSTAPPGPGLHPWGTTVTPSQ
eukprot:scaffold65349_cov35-Tisochrysis_lutea.AAC.2